MIAGDTVKVKNGHPRAGRIGKLIALDYVKLLKEKLWLVHFGPDDTDVGYYSPSWLIKV